jgi:hypothetical protein
MSMIRFSPALSSRFALRVAVMSAVSVSGMAAMTSKASADALPPTGPCLSATNSTSGQTIQVCGDWVATPSINNTTEVALACYAVSTVANVNTTIGCYLQGLGGGGVVAHALDINAPGDVAATAAEGTDPLAENYQVCMRASAQDAFGNTVTIPPTCG